MRCNNCGWVNPDGIQKCEKCETGLHWYKCSNGHYYKGDECPYCLPDSKEKEKLISQLEALRKDPPSFPPPDNAMCYSRGALDWIPNNDNKGNGWFRKVLIILAIILGVVAIVLAILLV